MKLLNIIIPRPTIGDKKYDIISITYSGTVKGFTICMMNPRAREILQLARNKKTQSGVN